jgi:hypothetical protein
MMSTVQSKPMNNQPKGAAVTTGRGVPIFCLWVCPVDGAWEMVHSGPYQDCYSHAWTVEPEAALTIQPTWFNPNN